MNCPKCVGKLGKKIVNVSQASKNFLAKVKTNKFELEVDQCGACEGVWFDIGELHQYLKERVTVINSPSVGPELADSLDKKVGKCPKCNQDMDKKPAPKYPKVTIDQCPKCAGIWLDSEEIDILESKNHNLIERFILLFLPPWKENAG